MESFPGHPKKLSERAEEIGRELGGGNRMSEAEKVLYLKTHGDSLFINADFVPVETYLTIFSSLNLRGKTILNVGAGSSMKNGVSPIIEALDENGEEVVCIPVDYNHKRTKSWDLLDTNDSSREGVVTLEPVTADATALPFPDGSIDGYISTNLINEPRSSESEVKFVKALFAEAYRVLAPEGFVIISSFGYFWWETKEGEILYNDSIDIEEMVSAQQVERYLREAGFAHIDPIPLDTKKIQEAIQERRIRKQTAVDAGVVEACAFFARK